MSEGDSPDVAAAIARLKATLDRQAVMAMVGLAAVAAFLLFTSNDEQGLAANLTELVPWFVGLSVVMYAANRWTLSLRSKAIRRQLGSGAGAPQRT